MTREIKNRTGWCVGGPYADKKMSSLSPSFRIAIRPPLPLKRPSEEETRQLPVTFGTYDWDPAAECWSWNGPDKW